MRSPYISQTQTGPQAVYDILRQVRVVRVPHQPDGHDLWGVHQHPADTQHLPTVTLWCRERRGGGYKKIRVIQRVYLSYVRRQVKCDSALFGSDEHVCFNTQLDKVNCKRIKGRDKSSRGAMMKGF